MDESRLSVGRASRMSRQRRREAVLCPLKGEGPEPVPRAPSVTAARPFARRRAMRSMAGHDRRAPGRQGVGERFTPTPKETPLGVRRWAAIEEPRLAPIDRRRRDNDEWIIQRHGNLTPAQVRASQIPQPARAAWAATRCLVSGGPGQAIAQAAAFRQGFGGRGHQPAVVWRRRRRQVAASIHTR